MNVSTKHIVGMLGVAAVLMAVLAAVGLPITTVLLLAFILACPLMMVAMMMLMGGNGMNHGMDTLHDDETHAHS